MFVALELLVVGKLVCSTTWDQRGRDRLGALPALLDLVRRIQWRSSLLLEDETGTKRASIDIVTFLTFLDLGTFDGPLGAMTLHATLSGT